MGHFNNNSIGILAVLYAFDQSAFRSEQSFGHTICDLLWPSKVNDGNSGQSSSYNLWNDHCVLQLHFFNSTFFRLLRNKRTGQFGVIKGGEEEEKMVQSLMMVVEKRTELNSNLFWGSQKIMNKIFRPICFEGSKNGSRLLIQCLPRGLEIPPSLFMSQQWIPFHFSMEKAIYIDQDCISAVVLVRLACWVIQSRIFRFEGEEKQLWHRRRDQKLEHLKFVSHL